MPTPRVFEVTQTVIQGVLSAEDVKVVFSAFNFHKMTSLQASEAESYFTLAIRQYMLLEGTQSEAWFELINMMLDNGFKLDKRSSPSSISHALSWITQRKDSCDRLKPLMNLLMEHGAEPNDMFYDSQLNKVELYDSLIENFKHCNFVGFFIGKGYVPYHVLTDRKYRIAREFSQISGFNEKEAPFYLSKNEDAIGSPFHWVTREILVKCETLVNHLIDSLQILCEKTVGYLNSRLNHFDFTFKFESDMQPFLDGATYCIRILLVHAAEELRPIIFLNTQNQIIDAFN